MSFPVVPTAQRSKRKFCESGWRPLDVAPGPSDVVTVCASNIYRRNARALMRAREQLKAGHSLPQAHHPELSEVRNKFSDNVALTGHPPQQGASVQSSVPRAVEFEHYRPRSYYIEDTKMREQNATYLYLSGQLPTLLPSLRMGHTSKPLVLTLSLAAP